MPESSFRAAATPTPKLHARFEIILKNGDKIRATACVKRDENYEITEYGIDVEIPATRVVKVIALPQSGH